MIQLTPARSRGKRLLSSMVAVTGLFLLPAVASAQPKDPPPADGDREEKAMSLAVGESTTVPAGDVKQYSEGPGGIADVRLSPDKQKFVVVGIKAGTTSLLLIKNDGSQVQYTINVFSQAPDLVENELRQLLDGYTGVKVRRVGSRLFIEGGVATKEEQEKIEKIAEVYTGQVLSLITVGAGAVDRKINIRVDFYFIQYNKNDGYQLGVAYPSRVGGEFIQSEFGYDFVSGTPTAAAAVVNQPLPGLDIASNFGWAKVLKHSTVVTSNGSEAVWNNGGEVNVPVGSTFEPKIEQIKFGIDVKVLPRYDTESRNIEIEVEADVADLTPPQASTLPGRQTAKVDNTVFLKVGEGLILSGIRTKVQRHQTQGLPLLSRIPVLGVLFGTHLDEEEEVEGAVFIIPSIVESIPKSSYDLVQEALRQYDDYSGDLDDVNSYPKNPPAYGQEGK
jgi:pilus assembly protein CpaC